MSRQRKGPPEDDPRPLSDQSTRTLLPRAQNDDQEALDELFRRYYPRILKLVRRWFHVNDRLEDQTADLVQITVLNAFRSLKSFENRGEGSFLAFLRQIVINKVRDSRRKKRTRPGEDELPMNMPGNEISPLEKAIGQQKLETLEKGLETLLEEDREAIILRFEYGYTFREVAEALGDRTENAVRMRVARAIRRLGDSLNGA
jgi:RNA polymerase sigma factor (sigma-70 family)